MTTTDLLDQIRSARITASPELRARVRELAAVSPPSPPRRREVPWRRLSLVLVPACLALALAGALVAGLTTTGKRERSVLREAVPAQTLPPARSDSTAAPSGAKSSSAGGAALPSTPGRAQLYEAELTLRVTDLSAATKRALRLTRAFNGYVRSVEYGSRTERGSAYLVLRVPGGSVQEALVRFSGLGEIVGQHVSIEDVQPQLDRRFRAMQTLRDRIAKLQARLQSPTLAGDERRTVENELVAARRQLVLLQREQAQLQRQASFATVSLDLRTRDAVVAPPHDPGRIERALERSASVLLEEAKILVYVLVVGAPLLALVALALGSARLRRRRVEARLLAR